MGQRTRIKKAFSLHFVPALLLLLFLCTGLCAGPGPCPDVSSSERARLNTCRVISWGRVFEQDARPEGCARGFRVLLTRHFKAEPPDPVLQVLQPPGCSGEREGGPGEGWDRPHESVLALEANQEYRFYLNGTDQRLRLVAALRGRCAHPPERKIAKRWLSHQMDLEIQGAWQRNASGIFVDIENGNPFSLECRVTISDHDSIPQLEWELPVLANKTGNVRLQRRDGSYKLRSIVNVTEAHDTDTGLYRCLLEIDGGAVEPEEVHVNVIAKNTTYVYLKTDSPNIHRDSSEEVDSVVWPLHIRAYPKPEFIWRKGDKVLLDSATPSGGGGRYSLDVAGFAEGEVLASISSPALADVGDHTVEAAVGGGGVADSVTLAFTMEVRARVDSFRLTPSRRMWRRNDTFQVTCAAEGYPRPSVELWARECSRKDYCLPEKSVADLWGATSTRLALQLGMTAVPREFELVRTQRAWEGVAMDPAVFVCVASNSLGSNASEPIELLVTDTEWNTTLYLDVALDGVSQDGHNLTFVEGDNLTFTCYGNKMLTSQDLRWKLDGERLTVAQNETDLSYVIALAMPDVQLRESRTDLICYDEANPEVAMRRVFHVQAMQKPAWEAGLAPPKDTTGRHLGDHLTLRCLASGIPPPVVVWYKDEKEIKENQKNMVITDQGLNFPYLLTGNTGEYKCVAKNRAGSIEARTFVQVTDPNTPLSHKTMVIIVSVSGCALLFVVVFVCVKIYNRKSQSPSKPTRDQPHVSPFEQPVAGEGFNSHSPRQRRLYALRLEDHRIFVRGSPERLNPQLGLDQQVDLLPYDTKFEVPRNSIIFGQLLGSGAFGQVYRATALDLRPGKPRTTVAVKMARSHADSAQLKALRSELKIMVHIGRHMNIVNLLGACSRDFAAKGELLLVVEYCKHGNILDYMRRRRKEFVDQMSENAGLGSGVRTSSALKNAHLHFGPEAVYYNSSRSSNGSHCGEAPWSSGERGRPSAGLRMSSASSNYRHLASDMSTVTCESSLGFSEDLLPCGRPGTSETSFCSRSLLLWAFQIAKGMEYLAFKKVLHGDLAARNILLTEDNVIKISDFGLAKDIYRKENYHKKSKGPMPVKWVALECLRDGIFSTQSDVWSFGVVLWEIFSLGRNPYSGVDFDEKFIAKLEGGVRLEQPKYATFDMYCTMRDCWAKDPLDRPSFSDLETRLGAMIGEANRRHVLELNQPYQSEDSDSVFITRLQSPDYSVKVHEGRIPGSDHSTEAAAPPFVFSPASTSPQSPRGACDSDGNYLSMQSSTSDH
ncbi:vascular endothelial growth factor receptor 1 isoform X2 [Penaeus vannamei]|uniref:vascular endothelial growth factor receptor 1 isoform X2 n=1 Tax=Penaeus vannamei TaxID=6689 RepID=UPI00387FAD7F